MASNAYISERREYKLELPADFGVSPTFNISDLRPYLGEADEMPSRTTSIQEGEDDEDIPAHDDSSVAIQGPITRARARQLQYQVKSFLSASHCQFLDILLPNDILIVRNEGQAYEGLKSKLGGVLGRGQGAGPEAGRTYQAGSLPGHEFESYSDSRTCPPSN